MDHYKYELDYDGTQTVEEFLSSVRRRADDISEAVISEYNGIEVKVHPASLIDDLVLIYNLKQELSS